MMCEVPTRVRIRDVRRSTRDGGRIYWGADLVDQQEQHTVQWRAALYRPCESDRFARKRLENTRWTAASQLRSRADALVQYGHTAQKDARME